MRTSIRTTSAVVTASASSASRPSPASPTTVMSALRVDHELQPGAHERLVVDEEDARRGAHDGDRAPLRAWSGSQARRARRSRPPDAGPAPSVPPRSSTRSRMPVSPRPPPSLSPSPSPSPGEPVPTPSSRTARRHPRRLPAQHDGGRRPAAGVLEHVGQRLLGDAVQRQAGAPARAVAPLALLGELDDRAPPRACARQAPGGRRPPAAAGAERRRRGRRERRARGASRPVPRARSRRSCAARRSPRADPARRRSGRRRPGR